VFFSPQIINTRITMYDQYASHWQQAVKGPSRIQGKWRSFVRGSLLDFYSIFDCKAETNFLRCLYCHYVFDNQVEDFKMIVSQLKKIGRFIDTDTCMAMIHGAKDIDDKYFHLSFDDGFRNNYTNAVPILLENEIPAIFFVPTSIVESSWATTYNYCKQTMHYKGVIEMLKWNDIKDMISHGFEIGSHTRTHARFSSISNNEDLMDEEITGSKHELEAITGKECKYISWPFGKLSDADNKSLEIVKRAGYCGCFGAFRGSCIPGKTDVFSIPRHQFEAQWPLSHIIYFAKGNLEVKM